MMGVVPQHKMLSDAATALEVAALFVSLPLLPPPFLALSFFLALFHFVSFALSLFLSRSSVGLQGTEPKDMGQYRALNSLHPALS
ncbi:Hypothetical protein NTJ_09265 [Nesidiocoris tenuis]|uniref:Uncharacterized protein n=1 Tax=Nesidiocoris tenuis TaxID=355587 RepID=A0ABN7AY34_9HEMI|nr:Hypothetical protein NTJ_09265 [Nesidiocoris tenuis]